MGSQVDVELLDWNESLALLRDKGIGAFALNEEDVTERKRLIAATPLEAETHPLQSHHFHYPLEISTCYGKSIRPELTVAESAKWDVIFSAAIPLREDYSRHEELGIRHYRGMNLLDPDSVELVVPSFEVDEESIEHLVQPDPDDYWLRDFSDFRIYIEFFRTVFQEAQRRGLAVHIQTR